MKLFTFHALAVAHLAIAAPASAAAAAAVVPSNVLARHIDNNVPNIDDPKLISAVMDAHWYWRVLHCAQELQWDNNLAQKALDSVNKCTHDMQHDQASNLSGVGPPPAQKDEWIEMARQCVHGWHEEETTYPYGNPEVSMHSGWLHFTQMVWRDTSRIGCAMANCKDATDSSPARIYCFYENGGNNVAEGQFKANVFPPICVDPTPAEAKAHYGF